MLLGSRQKDPKIMTRIGSGFLLAFFAMKLFPHPTSSFGDALFDGVHGALLGIAGSLLLWAAYLNGHRRRAEKN
jgi:uncharacterized membrane protein YccC